MKLVIITHPLRGNYGGMLQAYALQETLTRLGHAVSIADIPAPTDASDMRRAIKLYIKEKLALFCLRTGLRCRFATPPTQTMGKRFAARFIHRLPLRPGEKSAAAALSRCDACVVGSDQVWRCVYVRGYGGAPFFFLSQASAAVRARSISYAASFGTDTWEGGAEETAECSALLQDFKAVSVRESSGIALCRDALQRADAVRMPDPTLLATQEDYCHLIARDGGHTAKPKSAYCANYILDHSAAKQSILRMVTRISGLRESAPMMARADAPNYRGRLPMRVGRWLSTLQHADLMVTDSFHGCVFSIIFNIPFVCIINHARGAARMLELMNIYGLQDRLLPDTAGEKELSAVLNHDIDWARINAIRAAEKERALRFLSQLDDAV